MYKKLLCILFSLAFYGRGHCQSYQEKDFTRYTKQEGLSSNHILAIAQDSSGYLWIGTNKGLNRFDGKFFLNFFKNSENSPIPENGVYSLHVQSTHEITGATNAGAFSFDPVTRRHKYFIVPVDSIIFFWANQSWQNLKDKKGCYVVSTKTGMYIFDSSGKVICRYDHYSGNDVGRKELWFGNWLYSLSDGSFYQDNGVSGSLYNPTANKIDTFFTREHGLKSALIDQYGGTRLSFPGLGDELFILENERNAVLNYDLLTNTYSSSNISASILNEIGWSNKLFFINDSLFAITGKVSGFFLFHYNSITKNIWTDGVKQFPSQYCTSIFNDREGRLWIGTVDGLYKQNLRNAFFTSEDLSIELPSILNTGIQAVYTDEKRIFIGLRNEGGLLVLDKETKKILRHLLLNSSDPRSNTINFIFPYQDDTLWIGGQGVMWLNKTDYSSGLLNKADQPQWMYDRRARNFMEGSTGNIWISFGDLNTVLEFNRKQQKFIDHSQDSLLRITFCFSMAEDKQGNVWLAGDGMCRWNVQKQLIDTLIPYPPVSKSLFNYMQILDRDEKNNLWISSYDNEIIQYDCNINHMTLRVPENSMIDGYTVTNSPIINDNIWMGMTNGISAFNIKTYSIVQFNYADGLPSAVATSLRKGSFYDKKGNRFYFGAGRYLISFVPNPELSRNPLLRFSIETTDMNNHALLADVPISYSQNAVQLRFNVINFTDPEESRFSYRILDKGDSAWHELHTQNIVVLSKLPPGSHQIQAKLYSVNNRWPAQIQTIKIFIRPPFWKTPWFLILSALAVVAIFYFLYRQRIAKINQKANLDKLVAETEIKALHAQMNPHFIFNCLNSIREMILNNENQQASHYLSKFAHLIRITLNNSSKPFISLQNTIDYLKRYLEMEQIRKANFSYHIDVDISLQPEETFLPPMLIQPFIENAIWHGTSALNQPIDILISFLLRDDQLVCTVDDNGIGIHVSLKSKQHQEGAPNDHHSMGIDNVNQRIQVLNEKYNLHTRVTIEDKSHLPGLTETGTLVTLYLPIKPSKL